MSDVSSPSLSGAKAAMKYYQDEELMLKISQKMGGYLKCQAVNWAVTSQAICGFIWSTIYGSFNHPMENHDTSCFHVLLTFPHQSSFNIIPR